MKYLITRIDETKRCFYCVIDGKEEGFYLANKLAKIFMPHLEENTIVEFAVTEKRKRFEGRLMYQIAHFIFVAKAHPYQIVYDLETLRHEMKDVLLKYDHFLFLDTEMTMPQYGAEVFKTEIIQVGYVLSNKEGKVLLEEGYYLFSKDERPLNKRTKKFLSIDEETYLKEARPYQYFYDQMTGIIKKYHCPIVVWGKNDLLAIIDGFDIHQVRPFATEKSFIDLLKLHKDYFNLKDDLGLFKVYQRYYGKLDEEQLHDAKTDAIITKDIFDAFLAQMLS